MESLEELARAKVLEQGLRCATCPGREEGGEEFQTLTPASSALPPCHGNCRTSHHSPCVLQPRTAAHGPGASGRPLVPWPMSAIITCCWSRPPGPDEEGGSKGWRQGEWEGGPAEGAG